MQSQSKSKDFWWGGEVWKEPNKFILTFIWKLETTYMVKSKRLIYYPNLIANIY